MQKREITATVERITPVEAADILSHQNPNNYRKMGADYADRLAKAMNDGLWEMNGEPIIFDGNGTLLDGQHRLQAIVRSKKPVEMLVVRGVDPASVKTIDTGKRRTIAHILGSAGYPSANFVTAIVRLVLAYEKGTRNVLILRDSFQPQEYLAWLEKPGNKKLVIDLMHMLSPVRKFTSLSKLAGMAIIGMKFYPREKVMEWALGVANAAGPAGSPVQLLVRRLLDETAHGNQRHWPTLILMARSMKAHCEGTVIGKLAVGRHGIKTALPEFGA